MVSLDNVCSLLAHRALVVRSDIREKEQKKVIMEENDYKKLTREDLVKFFDGRASLSREGIAREAGISGKQLQLIVSGDRTLTDKSKSKLYPVIKLYGFKCDCK